MLPTRSANSLDGFLTPLDLVAAWPLSLHPLTVVVMSPRLEAAKAAAKADGPLVKYPSLWADGPLMKYPSLWADLHDANSVNSVNSVNSA